MAGTSLLGMTRTQGAGVRVHDYYDNHDDDDDQDDDDQDHDDDLIAGQDPHAGCGGTGP